MTDDDPTTIGLAVSLQVGVMLAAGELAARAAGRRQAAYSAERRHGDGTESLQRPTSSSRSSWRVEIARCRSFAATRDGRWAQATGSASTPLHRFVCATASAQSPIGAALVKIRAHRWFCRCHVPKLETDFLPVLGAVIGGDKTAALRP